MVHETGAHSTDLQSPESVEHLCEKCKSYAADWQPTADEIWSCLLYTSPAGRTEL